MHAAQKSHNTILIDGNGQKSQQKLSLHPLDSTHFQINHEFAYASHKISDFEHIPSANEHLRSLLYIQDIGWIVLDRIRTDQERKVDILWHWHPQCDVTSMDAHRLMARRSQGGVSLQRVAPRDVTLSLVSGQTSPEIQGWYSEQYNQYTPSTTAIYQLHCEKEEILIWLLIPQKSDQTSIAAKLISQSEEGVELELVFKNQHNRHVFLPFSDSSLVEIKEKSD